MVEPEDHILDVYTQDQALLHCDDGMRKFLAETPHFVPEGLTLLEVLKELFLSVPYVLLAVVMLVVPPRRKLPQEFVDLLHLPSRSIHQDLVDLSLLDMLDHVGLILVPYACCLALHDYVDRAHLGPLLADDLVPFVLLDQGCPHDAFAELFTDEVGKLLQG